MPHLRRWRIAPSPALLLLLPLHAAASAASVAAEAASASPLLQPNDSYPLDDPETGRRRRRTGLFCDTSADALSSVPAPRTCIDIDGRQRCWYTYTPPSPVTSSVSGKDGDGDRGVPLVLDLHGVLSCAQSAAGYTGWRDLAAANGFVLVWPQGIDDSRVALPSPCWNAGECCCFDRTNFLDDEGDERVVDVPDVPFLARVIADTVASSAVPVDAGRIYLAGHSNGCMMAQRFAAEMSGIVAAVCCHSGVAAFDLDSALLLSSNNNATMMSMVEKKTMKQKRSYIPTPVMTVHGDCDTTVPYFGGGVVGTYLQTASAESNAASWAAANGCDPDPSVVEDVAGEYETITYKNGCADGAEVELVRMYGVGHFPYRERNEIFGDNLGQTDMDTTSMAMEFCFRHRRDNAEVSSMLPPCTDCDPRASPTVAPTTTRDTSSPTEATTRASPTGTPATMDTSSTTEAPTTGASAGGDILTTEAPSVAGTSYRTGSSSQTDNDAVKNVSANSSAHACPLASFTTAVCLMIFLVLR